jgi:hypothetical protein
VRATGAMAMLSSSVSRCSKAPGDLAKEGGGGGQEGRVGERVRKRWMYSGQEGRLTRGGRKRWEGGKVGER